MLIVADDHATFAAGHVLVELEAEDRDIAKGAGTSAVNAGAVGLSTVLHDRQSSAARDLHQLFDGAGRAAHMNDEHGLAVGSNLALEVLRIHAERLIDIDQARNGSQSDDS